MYEREQKAWPGYSYDADILDYTLHWIESRFAYLDDFIAEFCDENTHYGPLRTIEPQVDIYPVPTTRQLGVRHVGFEPGSRYVLRDQYGRIVKQGLLGVHTTIIDTGMLSAGVYFIDLEDGVRLERLRWMKL